MLKLYYAPGTCALASHIALEEAGAAYTTERIDFKNNQQNSPEYLAINPKGRVPALVTDRGILTETPAILAFIAQSFPQAKLAPLDDPFAFAQVQAFNSYLCSTVHVAHAHKGRGYRWATEETSFADMKRKVPKTVGACFRADRTRHAQGPVGDGRAATRSAIPICLRCRAGWRATASISRPCRRWPIIASACRSGRRCEKVLAEEKKLSGTSLRRLSR